MIELTSLGIAATYFLDPDRGAERRRAARRWVTAGVRRDREMKEPLPAGVVVAAGPATTTAAPSVFEGGPTYDEPATPSAPDELVLLSSEELSGTVLPGQGGQWPRWGWALVLTITICAIAAFAAVGLGIWAIKHRTTTTRTLTTTVGGAAPVLADPAARRVVGTATQGHLILRLNSAGSALAVDGLPTLATGSRYRVWIDGDGKTTVAGGFAARRAILSMKPLSKGSRVTITREPAAAPTDKPRGPQVARVSVP